MLFSAVQYAVAPPGIGVWAVEWKISTISAVLTSLIDGFVGSLAITDTSSIILSSSSDVIVQPALTCADDYIKDAAQQVNSASDYDWSIASGVLDGHIIPQEEPCRE